MSDWKKIIPIMKETCSHAFLATCDGDKPCLRSVSPIVEDDGPVWVSTFSNSRKVKQIKKNPKVCLYFVSQPNGEQAAKIYGTAKVIDALDEKERVWNLAGFDLSKYFRDGPGSKDFCLLKIESEKIEWWENFEEGVKVYEPGK